MKILKIILNPLLEQTPDSHFVLRLFDKGENDLLNNKTIDSVPPMSPPSLRVGVRGGWHKYQRIIVQVKS